MSQVLTFCTPLRSGTEGHLPDCKEKCTRARQDGCSPRYIQDGESQVFLNSKYLK